MSETSVPAGTAVHAELSGQRYAMPVNFRALQALAAAGIDPLAVAANAAEGRPMLTLEQVVKVIAIGVQQSGVPLSLEHAGAHVIQDTAKHLTSAVQYVVAFCAGGPARKNEVAQVPAPAQAP